jgi:hypothetical protein
MSQQSLINKAKDTLTSKGFSGLVWKIVGYMHQETTRSLMPYKFSEFNGVKVPAYRKLDEIMLELDISPKPNYESGIVSSLEKNIQKSDKVVIIGGGLGVTAVKAAKLSDNSSNVEVFEASKEQIKKMNKTFQRQNIESIAINYSLVGPDISVWGSSEEATLVEPENLPKCDVLELDCEGSELDILRNMKIRPRVIIVESHGLYDSSTEEVIESLEELSYDIQSIEWAEETDFAKENDIKVVTGIYKN